MGRSDAEAWGERSKCVNCVTATTGVMLPGHGHPCRPYGADRNRGSEADMYLCM